MTQADADRVEKIAGFRQLEKNWNSYGSEPISEETIRLAFRVADVLGYDVHIVPCADGSIQFERDVNGVAEEISVCAFRL